MKKEEIKVIQPETLGWLEYKLNPQEMDYVWRCIKNKKERWNKNLAGNLSGSYILSDRSDWFWINVLHPLANLYSQRFENLGERAATTQCHPYCLDQWWVNFQKQNEFNPVHSHDGVWSFVLFMKIPKEVSYKKQSRIKISSDSNSPQPSVLQFLHINVLGDIKTWEYRLEPEDEGRILFFPARLRHNVYPFYNCDEDRITVAGNIALNTTKRL